MGLSFKIIGYASFGTWHALSGLAGIDVSTSTFTTLICFGDLGGCYASNVHSSERFPLHSAFVQQGLRGVGGCCRCMDRVSL